MDAAAAGVSLVLCNDKLSTYGAPDVLQLSVEELDGHFSKHHLFADRPANQVLFPIAFLLVESGMRGMEKLSALLLHGRRGRWACGCGRPS